MHAEGMPLLTGLPGDCWPSMPPPAGQPARAACTLLAHPPNHSLVIQQQGALGAAPTDPDGHPADSARHPAGSAS